MSVTAALRVTVRVQPRASSNGVVGRHGDALKVRLTAPPMDGAANEALADLLAESFGVSRRSVTIVSGAGSRTKVVQLEGVPEDRLRWFRELMQR